MAEKVSNSSKRLIEMMDKLQLKQTDIVEKTGITKSALSNYIHGTREPRQDQISKIADPYMINPTWLMGYDVPMFMSDSDYSGESLDQLEKEIIEKFRSLDGEGKKQFGLTLLFLMDQILKK